MSKSSRIEIIFHSSEPDGIRTYMLHLSTMKTFVATRSYLKVVKTLTKACSEYDAAIGY